RAVAARLSLASDGAHLAHAGAGRAGDGSHEQAHAAVRLQGGQRDAGPAAGCVAGQRARAFRPGHPTRDPAPVSQLAAGRAAGSGREPGAPADARAGRVGHAGPVHARALWGGIRGRARTGRADGPPRRGPLAVAGSPRRDRPGGGVPERRLAVSTLTRQPAHGREGWAEPAARGSAPRWMPPAWAITAACGLLYVIAAPPSRDLA